MKLDSMEDWEEWARLAERDPERFERERAACIEKTINTMSSEKAQKRCRQLQWKIDMVRKKEPNALASCIRIYDMLMDSVYGPQGLFTLLSGTKAGGTDFTHQPERERGRVISGRFS